MEGKYLVQQPKKLENLAIVRLRDLFVQLAEKLISSQYDITAAERWFSRNIEKIRNCLECNVPFISHNALVIEAIESLFTLLSTKMEFISYLRKQPLDLSNKTKKIVIRDDKWYSSERSRQSYIINRTIEILFTKKLTCLSLSNYAMESFGTSLSSNSYLLTSLIRLDVSRNVMNYRAAEDSVIQLVKGLPSLKYLSTNHFCTNSFLLCLAKNCKFIEEIILPNSYSLDDTSIDIITHLPNLRSVEMQNSKVSRIGIETLLKSCKKIEYIIGIYSVRIASALEQIASNKDYCGKTFQLKDLKSQDMYLTPKQLQVVVDTCPQIQKMTLVNGSNRIQTSQSNLMPLKDLQNLRELELLHYNFYIDQVDKLLEVRGYNLVHLHLEAVTINLNALMCINQTCPNLESFFIRNCLFVKPTLAVHDLFMSKHKLQHILPFRKLNRIILADLHWEFHPTAEEHLLFLLSNVPNVEYISVPINDDIMLKVLDKNPLTFLKELKILRSKLSKPVLDQILQNCIGSPEILMYGVNEGALFDSF